MRDLLFALTVGAGLVAGALGIDAVLRAGAADVELFRIASFD